jgi:tripartite ATP-independent transporter DctP family solute receptor
MRRRLFHLLATAVFSSALLLSASSEAAEINKHTIKFASANQKGHPQVEGMEKFADLLKESSDGKITIRLFPGGVLGGDVQTLSAVQGGTVEMSVMNAGLLAGLAKDYVIVDLPYLFDSPQQADAVMDGPVGEKLLSELPEKGLVGLAFWELGFRNLTNNQRPINKVEDIAGLKIRVLQSPIFIDVFSALGANPVPMPYTELYTALETGAVDGQENPLSNILSSKFFEVQDHLTLTQHVYNPQIVVISKKFWDQLNADEQKLIEDAAKQARDYQREVSRKQAEQALAEVKNEGMQVTELPPEEIAKLREMMQPVIEKHSKEVDPALMEQLKAELEKTRAKS